MLKCVKTFYSLLESVSKLLEIVEHSAVGTKCDVNVLKIGGHFGHERGRYGSPWAEIMQKQMLYMGPVLTLVIGLSFPAGLLLYWFVTTLFMVGQQYWILNKEKSTAE